MSNELTSLSKAMADAVEKAAAYTVLVDARFVQDRLAPLLQKQDLTRYVL